MENNFHYNSYLKKFGRRLRKESTKAEIRLWCELLRGKNMCGYTFLRQRPVGNYIADFMCKELNLIIEVDGYTHDFKETAENDIQRQQHLEAMGFTILRFSDQSVMDFLPDVNEIITGWILSHGGMKSSDLSGNLSEK
jgi:very-short-patch-repair endonuclease